MNQILSSVCVELEPVALSFDDIREVASSGKSCAARVIIEPEVAQAIIDSMNDANRPVRAWQQGFLQDQIEDGVFTYNGESIVFAMSARLINGQHRLRACAASGVPIEVLVVFGVPDDAYATIDQVSKRSGSDVLAVNGHASASLMAGTLRQVEAYGERRMGATSRGGGKKLANIHALHLAKKYAGIEPSMRRGYAFSTKSKLTNPSLAAALHYLFSQVDPNAANEFFDIVESGIELNRRYEGSLAEAASRLRETLTNYAISSRKASSQTIAAVWIKAWNAYMDGSIPRLFIYKHSEDQPIIRGLSGFDGK